MSQEPAENVVALRGMSRAVRAFGEVNGGTSQLAKTIVRRVAAVAGGACIMELFSDDCRAGATFYFSLPEPSYGAGQ